ncbi:MAG TPA: diphthamide biosynthesis enzyme Dph2, partial [Methanothrix sp.]|nr:diphthamide biosynthesis enzyme Dph2 [Methanothrix sp.]
MDSALSTAGSSSGQASSYDIELEKAVKLIRDCGAKRVGLQAPEGLKRACLAIAKQIEDTTGAEVMISGDPCYGACDVDLKLCDEVDLVLHLGHSELGEGPSKVIFLEARMKEDLVEAVQKAALVLKAKRVGVTTTIQHVHKLGQALDVLRAHGIEGVLGPAGGRVKYAGQVLGCCYSTAKAQEVEEYLFIGTGRFHPIGIALATGKRVVAADPVSAQVSEIDTDPVLRRRFGAITRAADARRFAILVSKKPGQRRMD